METTTNKTRKGPAPLPLLFDARVLFALFHEDCDDALIGESLGVGRTTVNKWRNNRQYMLNAFYADRIAIRIGTHPAMLWGRQWWETAEP
jgi:hypothetical protein